MARTPNKPFGIPVSEEDSKLLTLGKKRFEFIKKSNEEIWKEAEDCWNFRLGDQWPEAIKQFRTSKGQPCVTINWTDQFVLHVANTQRQNEPEVRFKPVGAGTDEQQADWRQGLYRHIENYSDADEARNTALEQALTGGFGYYRALRELVDEELNLQEIYLAPIQDCFTVYMDPRPKRIRGVRYPQYCFIVEAIPKDEYKDEYGESALGSSLENWVQLANSAPGWLDQNSVRVAEYYYIDPKTQRCHWARINGWEVLERRVTKDKYVPVVQVLGEEIVVNGKRKLRGVVYNIQDSQQTLNYATSAISQAVGMCPKAPYMVTPKMIEGHAQSWADMQLANSTYVLVNPDPDMPGSWPERSEVEPPIQAMVAWRQQTIEDFRLLTGLYQSNVGAPSNEQSGKAINARKMEGEIATYHFIDNMTRAIKYEAKVVSDMMKSTYDAPRVIQIVKPDESIEALLIGQAFDEDGTPHPNLNGMDLRAVTKEDGTLVCYDPTSGDYDEVVTVELSYRTRQEQASAELATLMAAAPESVPRYLDLAVLQTDIPNKVDIAKRLVPPDVAQQQGKGDPQQQLAQTQAILQQFQQQHAQQTAVINKLMEERDGKVVENQGRTQIAAMDNQTKERIAGLQEHGKLINKLIEAKTDLSLAAAERQMKHLHHISDQAHDRFTQAHDQAHEHAMHVVDKVTVPKVVPPPIPYPSNGALQELEGNAGGNQ